MPDVTDLRPGDPEMIAGYRVVSRLGAGGQGVVYLARTPHGDRVAIKQLRSGLEDERARQQFGKEVAAARRVAPFCTARVLDAQLQGPSPYVVSEYIDGPSLQQQIRRHGPMTGATLQRLAIGTVTALAAIHQAGVVHRDFKPANVMLAVDGPRVIDFGIARDLSTETTVTSRVFGTPAYMAPEQLRAERVGPPADLFAWASVIAYAATGRAPFEAPHMMAVVHRITSGQPDLSGIPAELLPVLRQCLDKDPARRPSAQQALARLLGRPAPDRDAADATQVLAEATGIVHAAAPAATIPYAEAAPTVVQPAHRPPPPSSPPPPSLPSAPSSSGHRVRTAAAALAVLAILAGAAWGLSRTDLLDGGPSSPGTPATTGAAHATSSPKARVSTAPPTTDANGGDNQGEDGDTKGQGNGNGGSTSDGSDGDGSATDGTIPEAFDGTWKGTGHQPTGFPSTWTARIDLDQGETTGKMELKEPDCSGPLTVTSESDDALVLDAVIDDNPKGLCAPHGTLRLVRNGSDRLTFLWQDAAHPDNQATGELQKD